MLPADKAMETQYTVAALPVERQQIMKSQASQLCQIAKTAAPGSGQACAYGMSNNLNNPPQLLLREHCCVLQNHCEHQNMAKRSFQLEHRPGIELLFCRPQNMASNGFALLTLAAVRGLRRSRLLPLHAVLGEPQDETRFRCAKASANGSMNKSCLIRCWLRKRGRFRINYPHAGRHLAPCYCRPGPAQDRAELTLRAC